MCKNYNIFWKYISSRHFTANVSGEWTRCGLWYVSIRHLFVRIFRAKYHNSLSCYQRLFTMAPTKKKIGCEDKENHMSSGSHFCPDLIDWNSHAQKVNRFTHTQNGSSSKHKRDLTDEKVFYLRLKSISLTSSTNKLLKLLLLLLLVHHRLRRDENQF